MRLSVCFSFVAFYYVRAKLLLTKTEMICVQLHLLFATIVVVVVVIIIIIRRDIRFRFEIQHQSHRDDIKTTETTRNQTHITMQIENRKTHSIRTVPPHTTTPPANAQKAILIILTKKCLDNDCGLWTMKRHTAAVAAAIRRDTLCVLYCSIRWTTWATMFSRPNTLWSILIPESQFLHINIFENNLLELRLPFTNLHHIVYCVVVAVARWASLRHCLCCRYLFCTLFALPLSFGMVENGKFIGAWSTRCSSMTTTKWSNKRDYKKQKKTKHPQKQTASIKIYYLFVSVCVCARLTQPVAVECCLSLIIVILIVLQHLLLVVCAACSYSTAHSKCVEHHCCHIAKRPQVE